MEHKGLYRQPYASTEEPGKNYILPFGKANYISKGDHITLICWGAMVQKSLDAIQNLNLSEDIVEIIDETKIEAAITSKTSAILATHVFGNPCNVEVIENIAKKHNLKVIYFY